MKVVLINPPDISVVRGYSPTRGISFGAPLGLAYIAAVLEKASFEVEIMDCPGTAKLRRFGWKQMCEALRFSSPDLIGITATTPTLMSAIELAKKSKEFFPEVPIIFGGHGTFTIEEEILKRVGEVDAIVCGEGEETAVELAVAFRNGSSLSNVRGICFRENGQVIKTSLRPFIQDLDSVPFPARRLLPMKAYIHHIGIKSCVGTEIITSRGCPFSCIFCASSVFWGHKFRARSPENVVEEVEQLYEDYKGYGLNGIYFADDNFTSDKERVLQICDLMIDRGLDRLRWSCQARVDCADEELFQRMYEAGCRRVEFGVESGNNEILRSIRKGITLNMVKNAVEMAKKAGIVVSGNFIVGLPGDTLQTIEQTIRFSKEGGFDCASFAPALVYPSTELARGKNIDWLTFIVEEEFVDPASFMYSHFYFHPCVPTYADRNHMKKVLGKLAKQDIVRKIFRFNLRKESLMHPIATIRQIIKIIRSSWKY